MIGHGEFQTEIMALEDILLKKKAAILKGWFNLIAQTHLDGGRSLLKNKDRFTNPIGHITSSAIDVLYEELVRGMPNPEKVWTSLEEIIKVRAVQDFTPSQAIAFVFLLKKAIRAELKDEVYKDAVIFEELSRTDSRIDELASLAFDIYMNCREKIYQVKVDEMKATVDNVSRLLERQSRTGAGI